MESWRDGTSQGAMKNVLGIFLYFSGPKGTKAGSPGCLYLRPPIAEGEVDFEILR